MYYNILGARHIHLNVSDIQYISMREEQDSELLQSLRRRQYIDKRDESKFLVFFKIDKELPLVGAGK